MAQPLRACQARGPGVDLPPLAKREDSLLRGWPAGPTVHEETNMSFTPVESYSAQRNTQREYELTIILKPSTNKEGIQELLKRLQAIFDRNGSRMQKIDNWGLRTLAYPIQSNRKGIYLYIRFLGGSAMVKELERNLRIYDEVVRFLSVVIDEDVNPEARPSDVDDETLDAATESAPDPLDIAAQKEGTFEDGDDDDDNDNRDDDDDDDEEEY
ncbi:30S ribosomal protein S6 [Pseudenhygromyxa sp. WMMC2535]|uniref:30S ribosomal protein S6 n=1 Tax=Pseudenhygromyxa sp. WMMC2535 TaxID=2712867 RepID=UPI0015961BF7|nr:30S ribosomal protein S6 [Pseudenhygromyxa sp. WMMC2535]NVB38449.1 30S ribosomal protein S6 [Pseudenhygromyxa sp. WMMC2535]